MACCGLIAPRCPDFGKIPGEFQKRPHRAARGSAKIAGAACVLPQLQSAHWPLAGDRNGECHQLDALTICRRVAFVCYALTESTGGDVMLLQIHVLISLIGIVSGLVVL
ncbi:MAG: hypothetical protein ACJ8EU_23400, partial [Xanthobacteraceae bacterium]